MRNKNTVYSSNDPRSLGDIIGSMLTQTSPDGQVYDPVTHDWIYCGPKNEQIFPWDVESEEPPTALSNSHLEE